MRDTIFFAVARDAEVEIWITQFCRSADRAFMKWFGLAARLLCKTLAPRRDFPAVPRLVNDLGAKKDQIIHECCHQRHAIGIWVHKKSK